MRKAISVLAATVLAAGCSPRFAKPRAASGLKQAVSQLRYTPEAFRADYDAYRSATDPALAKTVRDRMIYRILAETELYYRAYETRLFADRGRLAFGGELAELSLSAGAAAANGVRGKTILTTLLTALTGARLSYDQNFFRKQATEAILAQIDADRERLRSRIEQRMDEPVATYPFEAAWSDLVEFFYAGTMEGGLQSLHRRALEQPSERP